MKVIHKFCFHYYSLHAKCGAKNLDGSQLTRFWSKTTCKECLKKMKKPKIKNKDVTKKDYDPIGELEVIFTHDHGSEILTLKDFKGSSFEILCKVSESMKRGRR